MCNKKCESCKVQCKKSKLRKKGGYPMVEAISEIKKDIKRKKEVEKKMKNNKERFVSKQVKEIEKIRYGNFIMTVNMVVEKVEYGNDESKARYLIKDNKYLFDQNHIVVKVKDFMKDNNLSKEDVVKMHNNKIISLVPVVKSKKKVVITNEAGSTAKLKYKQFKEALDIKILTLSFVELNVNEVASNLNNITVENKLTSYNININNIYEEIGNIENFITSVCKTHTPNKASEIKITVTFRGKTLPYENFLEYIGVK